MVTVEQEADVQTPLADNHARPLRAGLYILSLNGSAGWEFEFQVFGLNTVY
jgi:hypothetical protein